jgi:hypothetical protein
MGRGGGDENGTGVILMEVGTADAAPVHFDRDLSRGRDGRFGNILDSHILPAIPNCCFHAVVSFCRFEETRELELTGNVIHRPGP